MSFQQNLIFLPVAQLDSASDSDSEGRRFESYRVGQKFDKFRLVEFFIHCESNGISSRFSVYLITEGAYHQPQAVFVFAMMIYNGKPLVIYNSCGIDDIHAYGVIEYGSSNPYCKPRKNIFFVAFIQERTSWTVVQLVLSVIFAFRRVLLLRSDITS